MMTATAIETSW